MRSDPEERQAIREYFNFNSQSHGDSAVHLEKAATENVGGMVYDIWDVSTENGSVRRTV